jgi:hypothetical protein
VDGSLMWKVKVGDNFVWKSKVRGS